MRKLRIPLHIVFYKDGELWISHSLEMDVMGHGTSKRKAFELMCNAVSEQIAASLANDNLSNIFQPADARFFQMYAEGADVADVSCTVHEFAEETENVEIEKFQAREFQGRFVLA